MVFLRQPLPEGADEMVETHSFPNSEALARGAYNPDTRVLTLWFKPNPQRGYNYPRVPAHIWEGLKAAPSAGDYHNMHIQKQYGPPPARKAFPSRRR